MKRLMTLAAFFVFVVVVVYAAEKMSGLPYIWITLQGGDGVWASHQLGFALVEDK